MDKQADYELTKEREHDAAFDAAGDEHEITLKLGDRDVSVFYTVDPSGEPTITTVDEGTEPTSFSRWQLDNWVMSIRRHERALADEAFADAMADRDAA